MQLTATADGEQQVERVNDGDTHTPSYILHSHSHKLIDMHVLSMDAFPVIAWLFNAARYSAEWQYAAVLSMRSCFWTLNRTNQ